PDNSRERRADFSAAHRARKSTPTGFGEVPQSPYRDNAELREASPELARILGIEGDEAADAGPGDATSTDKDKYVVHGDRDTTVRRARQAPVPLSGGLGVTATAQSLERLLREGRAEFLDADGAPRVWTPHRPPRPEKSEGGVRFVVKSEYEPKGDQPQAIAELVEGFKRHDRSQAPLRVTGPGTAPTTPKGAKATQRQA